MRPSKTETIIFLAAALTRLPFTSKLLYNLDSVQFALGAQKFDVTLHQPQPPGYFLYVLMGRAADMAMGDINRAFVLVSIIFSALTAVILYRLGREVFDNDTGVAAAVLFITSPLMWLHGEVALSYMPEAFMSGLFAYLCYKIIKGEHRLFWVAAVVLGVAGGIRQNTMVFLMPLWFYSMKGLGTRRVAAALAVFAVTVLAWFIPMTVASGGFTHYYESLSAHWRDSNWRGIHLHWIEFNATYMLYFILSGLLLALAPLIASLYNVLRGRTVISDRGILFFFGFWLMPPFLFHLIIFTHPAVPGHSLIYMVGLLVLAARSITCPSMPLKRPRWAFVAIVASVNTLFFLFAPYPLSAKGIREHDKALAGYIKTIRENFSPADTEIIGTDRFLYSYRHAMFYLPEFRVHDTVFLSTPDGPRLFLGQNDTTTKTRWITPLPSTRNFIDFINYGPGYRGDYTPEARLVPAGDGDFLVVYSNIGELGRVARLAPFIDPAVKKP